MKKIKLRKINRMRDEAWGWLSKYIRLKSADQFGMVECYTCGNKVHYKESNAGHFKHGHNKVTFLLEDNIKVQCVACNLYKSGVLDVYGMRLAKEKGISWLEELTALSHKVEKLSREYYQEKIDTYKLAYQILVKQREMTGYSI